tara:strand:+ start:2990 stop:3103 length:114 start_codon:yes stop_codon:yes gene_type:complete
VKAEEIEGRQVKESTNQKVVSPEKIKSLEFLPLAFFS